MTSTPSTVDVLDVRQQLRHSGIVAAEVPQPTATATSLSPADSLELVSESQDVSAPAPEEAEDPVEPTAMPTPSPEPEMPEAHTVQEGDTLLGLAMQYEVPMAAIQLQNDMGSSIIVRVGEVLEIPPLSAWPAPSPFWVVHEIESGETMSELAVQYGMMLEELAAVNPTVDLDRVSIGQPVILPLNAPEQIVVAAHTPPTPVPPPPTEAPEAPPPPDDEMVAATDPPQEEAPAEPTATPVVIESAPPADVGALPDEIFRLINEQRAAHGLPPLAWSPLLAQVAQAHANDCQSRGWCSHTGSDGSSYRERMIRAGYAPVRWSECWAWYGTPARAVAMWMNETPPNDPHRRTLLNPDLTEVGVGVVPGNGFGYYFIADFGKP